MAGRLRRRYSTTTLRTNQLAVENDALYLGMCSSESRSVNAFDRFHEYTTARIADEMADPHVDIRYQAERHRLDGSRDESTTTRAPVTAPMLWYTADDAVV